MNKNDGLKGILSWFAGNHVAANLLMMMIIVGGLGAIFSNNLEVFTDIDLKMIQVSVPYRGASPEEAEEGVCVRVEEAIAGIEDIKKITSLASEGMGTVIVELEDFADTQDALDDVKAEVDRIETFPLETEKPIVAELEDKRGVINIVVYGETSQKSLKRYAEEIRDDLAEMQNISQVAVTGVPLYEISLEVSEESLRKYNLSFDQIAQIVRNSSLDVPGGSVKTQGGEVLIRTKGQKYKGVEFEKVVVLTDKDGTKITLGDIGVVVDEFEDTPIITRFNGFPAVMVEVSRVGEQDALDIAKTVKEYLKSKIVQFPEGIQVDTWSDNSKLLKSRLQLLVKNGIIGLILVFIVLSLFLHIRLAFWTTMGIPISFLGAFWMMPMFDITINMISLYAFILCLGIVVDDAIVVGENIFMYSEKISIYEAACRGVKEMAMPVTFAVLTTIAAFTPLLFTKGVLGKFLRVLPIVVISVLAVSLVEALFLLPAHLHGALKHRRETFFSKIHAVIEKLLQRFVYGAFKRFVDFAIKWRYITLATGVMVFMLMLGLVVGGFVEIKFLDTVDSDIVRAQLEMPLGTPSYKTAEIVRILEKAALEAKEDIDATRKNSKKSIVENVAAVVGQQAMGLGGPVDIEGITGQSHIGGVSVELLGGEERDISSSEFTSKWRERVGEIAGISSLKYEYALFDPGEAVNVELSHRDFEKLKIAVAEFKKKLAEFPGVEDISDSFDQGKREIKLELTDEGRTLGLTLGDLARQARQGFYGEEIQRIQRGRDDIRVMLRYPKEERKSLADIENMRVRLPDGTEIPFRKVAKVQYGRGYSSINRSDRKRVISVTADVDETVANKNDINNEIFDKILPEMRTQMPGLNFDVEGEQRSRNESMSSLGKGFIFAVLGIYALLAIQFRSYIQPVIVMSAIPFGLIGAVLGHVLFGMDLSLLSMFGIVALNGIVVNDSLIMIDLINSERKADVELHQVLIDSATRRFRPIMLTTLTTFMGLSPMILEKSLQAQFLIPMAISLAFGVLFATCITLFLVPSLYMILEDIHNLIGVKSAHAA